MHKSFDLSKWHKVGGGANGSVYASEEEPDVLLKVNHKRIATEAFVSGELQMFRNVRSLGISVPEVYEIVKIGDRFAMTQQRIKNKKSFSRLLADHPDRFEEIAELFVKRAKELHATPCNTGLFESRKEQYHKAIDKARFIRPYKDTLHRFVDAIPDVTTCLHGDFQMGNLIQSEGKEYWIDLGKFAYGAPISDIAHFFNLCMESGKIAIARVFIEHITHLKDADLKRFWKLFVAGYYGITEEEQLAELHRELKRYYALDLLLRYCYQPGPFTDLVTLIMTRSSIKTNFSKLETDCV